MCKKLVVAITLGMACCTSLHAQYLLWATQPAPAQAIAAGYNRMSFYSRLTADSVDFNFSYPSGRQWYSFNFFGHVPAQNLITFNGDGSATIPPGVTQDSTWATAGKVGSTFVGTAFGCGAYFEAQISYNEADVNVANGWPAFWAMSVEHLVNTNAPLWPNQGANYTHFAELDFLEASQGTNNFTGAVHDWYGVTGVTCSPDFCSKSFVQTFGGPSNWGQFHTIGALWVPATASTQGNVTSYLDNIQIGNPVAWNQYDGAINAPPPSTYPPVSWTFGVADSEHFPMILSTGTGVTAAINVGLVRVFQGSTACNLVQ